MAKPTLNDKQKKFCREYVKTGNGMQSAIKAGYSKNAATVQASRLLTNDNIKAEIARLSEKRDTKRDEKAIADAAEVMQYFSAVMRGEIKDQFGLDASLNDRTKAAQELAKRTVDVENRIKGVPDTQISIKLDWGD